MEDRPADDSPTIGEEMNRELGLDPGFHADQPALLNEISEEIEDTVERAQLAVLERRARHSGSDAETGTSDLGVYRVRIVGLIDLQSAVRTYPDTANAITMWFANVTAAKWSNLLDLKADIPSAAFVSPYTVFSIHNYAYRLITLIDYVERVVIVRAFLPYAEFDKGTWK